MTLYEMTEAAMQLQELFASEDIDEQTLKDNLMSIGLDDKLDDYAKVIRTYEATSKALKDEEKHLKERRDALDNTVARMKAMLLYYMESTGKEVTTGKIFKFRVQENPVSVNIINEDDIPEEYWKKGLPTLNRDAIKSALKDGIAVSGAELTRTKGVRIV